MSVFYRCILFHWKVAGEKALCKMVVSNWDMWNGFLPRLTHFYCDYVLKLDKSHNVIWFIPMSHFLGDDDRRMNHELFIPMS